MDITGEVVEAGVYVDVQLLLVELIEFGVDEADGLSYLEK